MNGSPDLSAARRARELELSAASKVDLVVIGGGITGCGVALDAASRGLSVVLLERDDLASGTSGYSSKLIHGGLRYLAQGQIGVAAESARERHHLITRIAPHLVTPVATVIPFNSDLSSSSRLTMRVGYKLGDLLRRGAGTPAGVLERSKRIGADEAAALVPALSREGLDGALIGWDGRLEDDARLVVAVARTAAARGARILTRCAVTSVERGLVHARDALGGGVFTIAADHVINATGVWSGELAESVNLIPSKGSHIIVPADRLGMPTGSLTVPARGGGAKYVFAIPNAEGNLLIGLTDIEFEGELPAKPEAEEWEIELLLETISGALSTPLSRDDVIGSFAGLRPLLAPEDEGGSTADVSRSHRVIEEPGSGMLTIVGGKLTTYRKMAEDAVDKISERPCPTRTIALAGAAGNADPSVPTRLARRLGSEAQRALALTGGDRSLLTPLAGSSEISVAELRFSAAYELALSVDDLLDRRTRAGLTPALREELKPQAEAAIAWAQQRSQSEPETEGAADV
jgi:glycerol-3-phosphate dehydrogenase